MVDDDVPYSDDRVTGGDGEDVGAGDGLLADSLDLALDAVDDLEALERARVLNRVLLVTRQQN
jgi:hypothetical protein